MTIRRRHTAKEKGSSKSWIEKHREKVDFIAWLKIAPYKRMILESKGNPIKLAEDRGFLQILEIPGKDIDDLSKEEQQKTLLNYQTWLVQFQYGFSIYTTKLPTNTQKQIAYLQYCLEGNKRRLKKAKNPRIIAQLQDKEKILRSSIETEIQIQKEIYNSEFLLFLFGKSIKELDEITIKAMSYGNMDFVPQMISREKKKLILEQFNNMNDRL